MIAYGLDFDILTGSILSKFSKLLISAQVSESKKQGAIARAKVQSQKEFVKWVRDQAQHVLEQQARSAPQRSGNLSEAFQLRLDGNDWVQTINEAQAPYAKWVIGGRGSITARGKFLVFNDTRYGWRPFGNLARVTGNNAEKYPYTGNMRRKHTIQQVGGAPAIDIPAEGVARWEAAILPGELERMRGIIAAIVEENGGRVTRST